MITVLRKIKILEKTAESYLAYKLNRPKPLWCFYFMNSKCNLCCKYCPIGSATGSVGSRYMRSMNSELNTDQAKYAIDQLAKLGISRITFSGGEPLLRADLEEIAALAKDRGMYLVLTTNATLLTPQKAQAIGKYFDRVVVSAGGLKTTSDKIRGKNSFEKMKEGIKVLKKYTSCPVGIDFVICKLNYQEIKNIFLFAKQKCDYIIFSPVDYAPYLYLDKDEALKVTQELLILKREYKQFIKNTVDYINLFPKHLVGEKQDVLCDPFDIYVALYPNGDFSGCCSPYPVGNILRDDIKKLYLKGKEQKEEIKRKCGGCSILGQIQLSMIFRAPFYKTIFSSLPQFWGY